MAYPYTVTVPGLTGAARQLLFLFGGQLREPGNFFKIKTKRVGSVDHVFVWEALHDFFFHINSIILALSACGALRASHRAAESSPARSGSSGRGCASTGREAWGRRPRAVRSTRSAAG